MTTRLCKCGCGRPRHHASGYSRPCERRWVQAGRPESGPPPPMTAAQRTALALQAIEDAPYEPDAYDLEWAQIMQARRGREPDRRAQAAARIAGDLIRCVGASDAAGIERVLSKVTDWKALSVVLAECASPARAAVVCGLPYGPLAAVASRLPEADQEDDDAAA